MKYAFLTVPPNNIRDVWKKVKPFIAQAVRRGSGEATPGQLRSLCERGNSQLWVLFGDNELCGAGVTQVVVYPSGRRTLYISSWASSAPISEYFDHVIGRYCEFAKKVQCVAVEGVGRPGWRKYMREKFDLVNIHFVREIK